MSKHHLFRRIMSVMLVLCLSLSMIPLSVNAEENISTIPFSIDGTYYAVDMKFEGDQLYCRADQWAKAAGCLWVLNSDYQKVLFYYEDPVVLVSYDDQSYIVDGDDVWVPFFDVATQTGVYFPKVSGNQIYGYREKPLAVFYKDMDRMFAVSQYRTTEMIIELGNIWALIDSASRSYAILSSLSLKGFLDAVSGKMDQDMYDKAFVDILKTDETVLGALAGAGEALERPGKIVNLLQESLDEDGVLVELLKKMDFSENEIREIVWDLSQDAYGSKTLNDLSDFYEANQITHFLDMLKMVDNMTVSLEADIHTVTAMQKVFENSDSVRMRQAAQKAVGARLGNKVHTAGMYSLEFVGNILWDQTVEKLDELCEETLGTTSLQKLAAEAFVWVFDKSLSLTETTDAIMYSDVYSQVQLELVNYYFRHRNDDASDNGLMMHSVALLYLRSCLAAWQMFEYDESLAGPIDNATSLITAEITNLMKYTEEALLQNGTSEETKQAVVDLVKQFEKITLSLEQSAYFESIYLEFLKNHPEYNYYAVLDINKDGIFELFATDDVTDDFSPEYLFDVFVYRDGKVCIGYEDIWAKYSSLEYDSVNEWFCTLHGGTSGGGVSFYYLDEESNVQTISYDLRCHGVDEQGNEVWTQYYNDEVVNEETKDKFDWLYERHQSECKNMKSIVFQPLPKAALVGEWKLYCGGIPYGGYWMDVWLSSLNLKSDGTAEAVLAIAESEAYRWYTGTWTAEPSGNNEFLLKLDVAGGPISYGEESSAEENSYSLSLKATFDKEYLSFEKISGEDICLYYGERYERNLQFETWMANRGTVRDPLTFEKILQLYPETAEYTVYDIDKDGVKELLIREASNNYLIFTYADEDADLCSQWILTTCNFYPMDGNGVIVQTPNYVSVYELTEGYLQISTYSSDVEAFLSDTERKSEMLNFIPVSDKTLLKK